MNVRQLLLLEQDGSVLYVEEVDKYLIYATYVN